MTCFPFKLKNERCACEPFVKCINVFYSRNFIFHEIPDRIDRKRPMPDTLYQEIESGARLAIERKNIVYPRNYAKRHNYDHKIMDLLFANLPEEISKGPFVFKMPMLHSAQKDKEIDQLAQDICKFVSENIKEIQREGGISFIVDEPGGGEYFLYQKNNDYLDEYSNGPWNQLLITMSGNGNRIPRFNWSNLDGSKIPIITSDLIQKCNAKFKSYDDAQRVLLLERYGEISGPLNPAFESLIHRLEKPETLDEIWDAWTETPDYDDPYWIFTRLWAKDSSLPQGWQRAEICCKRKCHCHAPSDPEDIFWFVPDSPDQDAQAIRTSDRSPRLLF